ncbi:MAG: hypothetical protein KIT14_21270 [bacterium]|nr:hypothetical protein [bacterium]
MPQLLLCTLCDDVRFEVGNKHTLVGLFDTFNVTDFAQPLPPFRVFARLAVDAPGTHTVVLRIQHVETDFRVEVTGRVDARQPSEVTGRFEAIFSATLPAIRLPGPGRYDVRFAIGGTDIGGCAFLAHEVTRPVLQ